MSGGLPFRWAGVCDERIASCSWPTRLRARFILGVDIMNFGSAPWTSVISARCSYSSSSSTYSLQSTPMARPET